MTSDELKESMSWIHLVNDKIKQGDLDIVGTLKMSMPVLDTMYKAEIALQLALLREHMERSDESFFGGKRNK